MNTLRLTAAAIALAVAGSVYAGGAAPMSAPAAPKAPAAANQQKMFVRMGFGFEHGLYNANGDVHSDGASINQGSFAFGYNIGKSLAVVAGFRHTQFSAYEPSVGTFARSLDNSFFIAPEYHMNMGGADVYAGLGLDLASVMGTDTHAFSHISKGELGINAYLGVMGSISKNVKIGGSFGYITNDHKWAHENNEEELSGLTYTFNTQIGF